jgi:hypothetical protein
VPQISLQWSENSYLHPNHQKPPAQWSRSAQRWRGNSYLYPNHQIPPEQCPISALDGGKIAISNQTIKTHLHSAPDQPLLPAKKLSLPNSSKRTCTVPKISPRWREKSYLYPTHQNPPAHCPRSAPHGGIKIISTQTIETWLHSAPDQSPMAENY